MYSKDKQACKPLRIVVTGHSGQVVTALVEHATKIDGLTVVPIGRPELDLCDTASIAQSIAALAPDVVVSAAAYTAVDQAEDEPEQAQLVNALAAGEVAKGAAMASAPIIHLSTDYVFDGTITGSWKETDQTGPLGVYGATKLAGEALVAEANSRHLIMRTAWVYSPWGKNFVRTMLALAKQRDQLTIVDDQYGCPTSALDIADAILIASRAMTAQRDEDHYGIFHFAGTGTATWCDFAREIFRQAAVKGEPHARTIAVGTGDFPTKARRPANSRLDSSKFEAVFGHRAPPWQQSLSIVIDAL